VTVLPSRADDPACPDLASRGRGLKQRFGNEIAAESVRIAAAYLITGNYIRVNERCCDAVRVDRRHRLLAIPSERLRVNLLALGLGELRWALRIAKFAAFAASSVSAVSCSGVSCFSCFSMNPPRQLLGCLDDTVHRPYEVRAAAVLLISASYFIVLRVSLAILAHPRSPTRVTVARCNVNTSCPSSRHHRHGLAAIPRVQLRLGFVN